MSRRKKVEAPPTCILCEDGWPKLVDKEGSLFHLDVTGNFRERVKGFGIIAPCPTRKRLDTPEPVVVPTALD